MKKNERAGCNIVSGMNYEFLVQEGIKHSLGGVMMFYWFRYPLMWCIVLFLLTGCPTNSMYTETETEEKVEEAKDHFEMAERVQARETYYNEYLVAQTELQKAEVNLEKRKIPEAYLSAAESIRASKAILKKFYLDTFAAAVEKLKAEIEVAVEKDPDNPVKDFLPQLDNMLDYAAQLQSGQQEVSPERVNTDTTRLIAIADSKQRLIEEKLESDISFPLGSYELEEQGKFALAEIVRKIVMRKDENLSQYPDKSVTIKVKVVGYTDETGFRDGSPLIGTLMAHCSTIPTQRGLQQRQALNRCLSELRANTISNYLFGLLVSQIPELDSDVFIEQEVEGKGEDIPPGVPAPYPPTKDPRRRICKVYSYVIAR